MTLPACFLLINVLMDKTSLMGVFPPPLGPALPDGIIGLVIGFSTAIAAVTAVPWLGTRLPRRHLLVSPNPCRRALDLLAR